MNIIVVLNIRKSKSVREKTFGENPKPNAHEYETEALSRRTSEAYAMPHSLPLFIRRKSETRFHRFCPDDNITAVQIVIVTTSNHKTLAGPIRVAPRTAHRISVQNVARTITCEKFMGEKLVGLHRQESLATIKIVSLEN